MHIVIAGGGKLGELLCAEFAPENDVVLIDHNDAVLQRIVGKHDLTVVNGKVANYDVLQEAGVPQCDVFIATVSDDETNLIAAIIAKTLGAHHTVARVRSPEFASHFRVYRESLGIDKLLNQDFVAAQEIAALLRYPSALGVESFAHGLVSMVALQIEPGSVLDGMRLTMFRQRYHTVLACNILRGDVCIIPKGDTVLYAGDRIEVTGRTEDLDAFFKQITAAPRIRSVLIIGGGRIGYYLLGMLLKSRIAVKLIEVNSEIAHELSGEYPDATVIVDDGTDHGVLEEERIEDFDAVIALTGVDEENILISLYAASRGVEYTVTKINRTPLLRILGNVGLQSIITPKRVCADRITRFVRSLIDSQNSNMTALYRLANDQAEALEFEIKACSQLIGKPLKALELKPNVLIAAVERKRTLIFPDGDDDIRAGDRIIVITTDKTFDDADDLLVTK